MRRALLEKFVNTPLTIGHLKLALRNVDHRTPVVYDHGARPHHCHSWRGHYRCPAIGHTLQPGETSTETVLALLDCLTTYEFYGWKGGEYRYTDDDVLYIDNEGESTGYNTIYGVEFKGDSVVLHTQHKD